MERDKKGKFLKEEEGEPAPAEKKKKKQPKPQPKETKPPRAFLPRESAFKDLPSGGLPKDNRFGKEI